MIPHTIAPSHGFETRYAIYFRLTHTDRPGAIHRPEVITNAHLEFEGVWDVFADVEGSQPFMYAKSTPQTQRF